MHVSTAKLAHLSHPYSMLKFDKISVDYSHKFNIEWGRGSLLKMYILHLLDDNKNMGKFCDVPRNSGQN
jgi:hypothetical protein